MTQIELVRDRLIESALQARGMAYAPYSNYKVGSAIMAEDGQIYCGCNIENASYGLTVCAERNAVAAMVAAGCYRISAVAIALSGNGSPCGACRQVLAEFGSDFPIFACDPEHPSVIRQWNLDELLPASFRLPPNPASPNQAERLDFPRED
jgi:cytidine deaminase